MSKPKLTYFDAPVSRGEECRLALQLAGVDFEDVRVKMADWPAVKATTPFGAVPVFELPGRPPLAHSNAILTLIGRKHDLHPKDEFVAAQHEAIMCHVEDMRIKVSATMQIKDEADKRADEAKLEEELRQAKTELAALRVECDSCRSYNCGYFTFVHIFYIQLYI